MEDKIFEMVIESMKQKLIFSDMVEMRKIIKGAVKMMEAHYEGKIPSMKRKELIKFLESFAKFINSDDNVLDLASHNYSELIDDYLSTLPDEKEDEIKDCTTCKFLEVDEAYECNKCDEDHSNWSKSTQP